MPKLVHERWKCIGCGACIAVAGEFWDMGGDGKAVMKLKHIVKNVKDGELHEAELKASEVAPNEEAANTCPVTCIKVNK